MCIIPEKHIVYQHMYLGLQGNFFNKKSKIQKQTKASWVYGGGCGGKSGGGARKEHQELYNFGFVF